MKNLLLTTILIIFFSTILQQPKIYGEKYFDNTHILNLQNLTSPKFPGGEKAFAEFLSKNLKWPAPQIDAQGKVIISFYVEWDGHLTNFKVERSLGKEFDAEALRVLKKSPKWLPATRNRVAIKSKYSVPIRFYLSE